MSKQNESKKATEDKIMELQQLIDKNRASVVGQLIQLMVELATTEGTIPVIRKCRHNENATLNSEDTPKATGATFKKFKFLV